jgi:urease accessory protein
MNIRTGMADAQAPGTAISFADIVKLQAWFSPAFPVGAFSYSHGLEWAVDYGDVRCAASLRAWIEGVLRYGSGRSDAIILCAIWRAVRARGWSAAHETSSLAAALQPTAERRLESLGQGTAFLAAVSAAWPHPVLHAFQEACPGETALPAAVGAAAAAHGVPLEPVLVAFLHAFAANLVSAGIRLVPLGQTEGLQVTASLEAAILDVADEARGAALEALGSAGILADVASMRHETQYTRLFRS